MDKLFLKFIGRKGLKKIENHNLVYDDVKINSGRCLPRDDRVEYVNLFDDEEEESLVSEYFDEDENLHDSGDNMHDNSDKIDKAIKKMKIL